jgi:hypothetical protein
LPRTAREVLILSCISWYFPEELGVLLRLKIEEEEHRYGPDYEQKIALLLKSEPEAIIYILESNVLGNTPEEVFGNILAIRPRVTVYPYQPRRPKRAIRHRGYRDKGSLRQGSEYLQEELKDFSATEEQLRIEEQRENVRDSIDFCSGFLE